MKHDRPLGLADLAQTDSPEVVRTALSRFRRRMLLRGVLIPAVIAGIIIVPRLLPGTGASFQQRYREADKRQGVVTVLATGKTGVVALEAARLDKDTFAIRFVVTTTELRGKERLAVGEGVTGVSFSCEPERRGPLPPAPEQVVPSNFDIPKPGTAELLLLCPVGTRRATIDIGALYRVEDYYNPATGPPPTFEPKGPGAQTQEECAVPINPIGVCAMTKAEGTYRELTQATFDTVQLGIRPDIWRNR